MSRPEMCKPEEVYEKVKDLPRTGILKQNTDGTIFLDIEDEWIFNALEVLKPCGFVRPPFFIFPPTPIGAHIKVITKKEVEKRLLFDDIEELGNTVNFEIVRCFVSYPRIGVTEKYGIDANYKIRIESPELEIIRRNLIGLAPPQSGFFILVGVRVRDIMDFLDLSSDTVDKIEEEGGMEEDIKNENDLTTAVEPKTEDKIEDDDNEKTDGSSNESEDKNMSGVVNIAIENDDANGMTQESIDMIKKIVLGFSLVIILLAGIGIIKLYY